MKGFGQHAYLDQQNSTMHHTNFSSVLKSTIALGSMLGISSVIGVQTLHFISPESEGHPRPFSAETIAFNQPPTERITAPAAEPVTAPDSPPPGLPPQNIPPDFENDPVFQEIKKAFMPSANKESQLADDRSNAMATIPDAQWHAVEHLLQAARELESVERSHLQNRDSSQATKTREWIQQIRTTASQLIQSP
ncbi:hypothetical protein SH501x_000964 [Pirellulaceae bacterium SH501]